MAKETIDTMVQKNITEVETRIRNVPVSLAAKDATKAIANSRENTKIGLSTFQLKVDFKTTHG